MALRAGYYGVKRRIKDKIEEIVGSWETTIASLFPRSEEAVLGARNFYNGDDPFTLVKSTARTYRWYSKILGIGQGEYRISFKVKDMSGFTGENDLFSVRLDSGTSSASTRYKIDNISADGTFYSAPIKLNASSIHDNQYLSVYFFINNNEADAATVTIYDVMWTLVTDTDINYSGYSMTNQELTASADDQKTAINAIITAATGAADFAAFKAAMEAITPVTRSLSTAAAPEEIVKDEIEEPVVEKKTTTKKKSTAKAETQEEV